jgi:hypothetical protein
MKYRTLVELYLTFLTHNDSYMERIPVGTILTMYQGDLCYNGNKSIDNEQYFLYHRYIETVNE